MASTFTGISSLTRRSTPFTPQKERADAVKEAFRFAWSGYYDHAFPNDELHPVSNGFGNSRNGWGASAVDALSTAIIMELDDIVESILDWIPTIDFSQTDSVVSIFETTIRYLGGMLSGYDLLQGPFAHLITDTTSLDALLTQSQCLADLMAPAFDTRSGIPDNEINITTGALMTMDQKTGLAVAGTLIMEWTRLSDILGDPYYARLAETAESYLLRPQYEAPFTEPFPGLEGSSLNYTTGKFIDASGGWVGGSDSFYEYLIKMWVYDTEKFAEYRDRWIAAADSSIAYLLSNPSSRPDITFMAGYQNQTLVTQSQHLAGFVGGNFLLGGLVLDRKDYIAAGLQLTSAWHETYASDFTRIGPERFGWISSTCEDSSRAEDCCEECEDSDPNMYEYDKRSISRPLKPQPIMDDSDTTSQSAWRPYIEPTPASSSISGHTPTAAADSTPTPTPLSCSIPSSAASQDDFYAESGYYILEDSFNLRPEVLESYYYAYRITGDSKYQDWAWEAFLAINNTARVGSGFSAFSGVNSVDIKYSDNQESFLFAELLKYAYLIFAEEGEWQVNCHDEGGNVFVYNTEAHPLRVRNPPMMKRR